MGVQGVYRTAKGTVWRLVHTDGGMMRVELLKEERWVPGPIAMAGLRLATGCVRLTPAAISKLPE